jgi:acetolactate synthase regulatory subunit
MLEFLIDKIFSVFSGMEFRGIHYCNVNGKHAIDKITNLEILVTGHHPYS